MVSKMCFAFLAALLVLQGVSGDNYHNYQKDHHVARGIVEAIQSLIQKGQQIIKDAKDKLFAIANKVTIIGQNAIDTVIEIVNNTLSSSMDQISSSIKKATEIRIDVKECTAEKVDLIQKIPNDAVESAITCVNELVDTFKAFVTKAIDSVEQLTSIIKEIIVDVANCGAFDIPCYTKVFTKITEVVTTLAKIITTIIAAVDKLFSDIEVSIGNCTSTIILKATNNMITLTNEVVSCINDKIAAENRLE